MLNAYRHRNWYTPARAISGRGDRRAMRKRDKSARRASRAPVREKTSAAKAKCAPSRALPAPREILPPPRTEKRFRARLDRGSAAATRQIARSRIPCRPHPAAPPWRPADHSTRRSAAGESSRTSRISISAKRRDAAGVIVQQRADFGAARLAQQEKLNAHGVARSAYCRPYFLRLSSSVLRLMPRISAARVIL